MPEYIKGRPDGIKCMVENAIANCGFFRLIHDGGQSDEPFYSREGMPEQSQVFTRVYQLFVDGRLCKGKIVFRYDYRNRYADVTIATGDIKDINDKMDKAIGSVEHE